MRCFVEQLVRQSGRESRSYFPLELRWFIPMVLLPWCNHKLIMALLSIGVPLVFAGLAFHWSCGGSARMVHMVCTSLHAVYCCVGRQMLVGLRAAWPTTCAKAASVYVGEKIGLAVVSAA